MTDNILSYDYYSKLANSEFSNSGEFSFFYEVKSNLKKSDVKNLSMSGVKFVQPGIESFSSNLLSLMKKGVTGIQNVAFLKYAREHGVLPIYNLLFGFPGENESDYFDMISQFPAIYHLTPPVSCVEIEIHRYSPYFSAPNSFDIKLRPLKTYSYLYPFEEESIARIAYIFERAGEKTDYTYRKDLLKSIDLWRKKFDSECPSLICELQNENSLIISDTRKTKNKQLYHLMNFAKDLILMLDEPSSLQYIYKAISSELGYPVKDIKFSDIKQSYTFQHENHREHIFEGDYISPATLLKMMIESTSGDTDVQSIYITFSKEDYVQSPLSFIQKFVDLGLIYIEGEKALALPLFYCAQFEMKEWLMLQF